MTNLEKKFAKMTPAERKKATADISKQMGVMNAPKKTAKKTTKKK